MRTRTPAALAIVGALALAACGSDDDADADADPVTTEAMSDDEMTDDEMTESTEAMSDDEMTDDEMTDDDMSDDEMSDDGMAAAEGDVVVVAGGRDDLTTLVAAIEAAGLAGALSADGPFTVFAPNDAAFAEYLGDMGMTVEDALVDTTALSTLLQGHVVEAADDSSMVAGMVDNPFVSLAGTELPVTVDGDTITIGGAEIVEADVFATNGVIHVIDAVLAP